MRRVLRLAAKMSSLSRLSDAPMFSLLTRAPRALLLLLLRAPASEPVPARAIPSRRLRLTDCGSPGYIKSERRKKCEPSRDDDAFISDKKIRFGGKMDALWRE
ncbi:unnamed protein product [Caenorhabditis sp. 36 PRJEB53466]|nr:unnamed protein product [Caenorhabditis sp. 36 PRJEB53466]